MKRRHFRQNINTFLKFPVQSFITEVEAEILVTQGRPDLQTDKVNYRASLFNKDKLSISCKLQLFGKHIYIYIIYIPLVRLYTYIAYIYMLYINNQPAYIYNYIVKRAQTSPKGLRIPKWFLEALQLKKCYSIPQSNKII